MDKKIKVPVKRGRGRPRTNPQQVRLTLLPAEMVKLDAYARREGLTRHMAARRVIEMFFGKRGE